MYQFCLGCCTLISFFPQKDGLPQSTELTALHTCLAPLQTLLYTNGMAQNHDKSSAILLGTAQRAPSYSSLTSVDVAGTPLLLVNNIKLLGVTLNTNLTMWEHIKRVSRSCFYHIRTFRHIHAVLDKSTTADIAAALVSSRLDYANSVLYGSPSRCLKRLPFAAHSKFSRKDCVTAAITILTGHTSATLLASCQMADTVFKLASLNYKLTKSYTPVFHHICLNASIPTFLLAPCDHPPLLTCTSLALIFSLVHAHFILQREQSGILSLPLFVRFKP